MKVLKKLFNVFLSLSLILTHLYSYSTAPSNEGETSSTEQLLQIMGNASVSEEMPEEFREASRIFTEMGNAVENGKFKEYLESHPDLVKHFDILSLRDQEAHIVNVRSGQVDSRIGFNTYTHHSYPMIIQSVEVEFLEHEGSQSVLAFKGVIVKGDKNKKRKQQIGVIHYFKGIEEKDIIDWNYDKEILALLHKKKGLILYHVVLAKVLLGEAPIPSITIPVNSDLLKQSNLKLEFIDRSIKPPEQSSESLEYVSFSTEGEPLYSAGDLLISHTDNQGAKKINYIFSRKNDLYKDLFRHYVILDFLLQMTTIQIQDMKDAQDLSLNMFYLKEDSVFSVLSAVLGKEPLLFLKKLSSHIKGAKDFLLYPGDKDLFSQSEWIQDYERLIQNVKDNVWKSLNRSQGNRISSGDIASALSKDEIREEGKERSLHETFKEWLEKEYPKLFNVYKEKAAVLIFIVATSYAVMHAGSAHVGEDGSYSKHTIYNIIFFGVGLLSFVYALAHRSIWMLEKLEKVLPKGPFKIRVNQAIEKWKDQKTKSRLVGVGFKIAAFLIRPFWVRIAQLAGKPHVFSLWNAGLSARQTIDPESEIGRQLHVKNPRRLGGGWMWRSSTAEYRNQEELIDAAIERDKKIRSLSRIISYYALSGEHFAPSSLLSGLALLSRKDRIKEIHADKNIVDDFIWVSEQLSDVISKSDRIDVSRPVFELDKDVLNKYYNTALNLVEQSKDRSVLSRKVYSLYDFFSKQVRNALSWNIEKAEILSRHTPSSDVAELFSTQLIMDHLTVVTIPLTPLTPRGEYFAGNVHALGVENRPGYFFASPPHFHEGVLNVGLHTVQSARNQLQQLSVQEALLNVFKEVSVLYEPLEKHRNKTKNPQRLGSYLGDFLKYPFSSWGLRYEQGTNSEERLDVGERLWNLQKLGYRFFQVSFFMMVTSRLLFTESSISDAILGSLYFIVGAFIYFGWPQVWMTIQDLAYSKKHKETKNKIDRIKLVAHKIENNLYTSESQMMKEYKIALEEFKGLYFSSKKVSKNLSLDSLNSVLRSFVGHHDLPEEQLKNLQTYMEQSSSLDKIENLRQVIHLLSSSSLPTEMSKAGQTITSALTLGLFSNLAFVYLSVDSFDPQQASFLKALSIFAGTALGMWGLSKLTSRTLSDRFNTGEPKIFNEKIDHYLFEDKNWLTQNIVDYLKQEGIINMKDLVQKKESELLDIRGIDPRSVSVIKEALDKKGLSLGMDISKAGNGVTVSAQRTIQKFKNKCAALFKKKE